MQLGLFFSLYIKPCPADKLQDGALKVGAGQATNMITLGWSGIILVAASQRAEVATLGNHHSQCGKPRKKSLQVSSTLLDFKQTIPKFGSFTAAKVFSA